MKRLAMLGVGALTGAAAGGIAAGAAFRLFDPVAAATLLAACALLGALIGPWLARHPAWAAALVATAFSALFLLPPVPQTQLSAAALAAGALLTALPAGRTCFALTAAASMALVAGGVSFTRGERYDLWLLWLAVPVLLGWFVALARRRRLCGGLAVLVAAGALFGTRLRLNDPGAALHGRDRLGDWSCSVTTSADGAQQLNFAAGGRLFVFPRDLGRRTSAMLPALLQSPALSPSILLVADAPTSALNTVEEFAGKLALLSDGRRPLEQLYQLPEGTVCYWSKEAFFRTVGEEKRFDVIVVLELPPLPASAKARLLDRLRACLADDGALVTPRGTQPGAVPLPGCPEMEAKGAALATDFAALSARLRRLDPDSLLPPLLETLYRFRTPEPSVETPPPAGMRLFAAARRVMAPVPRALTPWLLLAIFWGVRLWTGRSPGSGPEWRAFAGGAAVMTAVLAVTMAEWRFLLLPGRSVPTALVAAALVFPPWRTARGGGHPLVLTAGFVLLAVLYHRDLTVAAGAGLLLPYLAMLDRWRSPAPAGFEWSALHYLGLLAGAALFLLLPPETGLWFAAGVLLPDLLYRPRRSR